ncbi:tRNA (adenosine(37)-N6)-threonylcarbamoyltransferase complex ATPase subunit type 1 TsaE [Octadecabacter sp. 1_MG-2023]|uniref:tRNA (adenosine(37)-N6)-threonylcarbamoyltransferase complex ATPase subunit type 1 TsaE n=1 Tax=unclassified Octadecabacter TaxID=196158 RepID=UPI001C0A0B28|nr:MULTISPECIES: tRNA (adenosine(37)-N6)-threonylcarbamoyltransferase complex ATPase subunit type 1 TsaE [unclassified Octadecabacter]MBU2992331.1 tRNA (adenosine(37)-N6)-threonylcarbamoyltransferase complex ATPase subunit type 1 TsaE [Octadecabacter sp. B2R22]MDO6734912.1 tRNA (adenosine(37)-N6)-threonylcarbamoyltransferase complex ATPase subunit type 1 TsaE [Octadecabacter sp. 1_MG-2023]
MAKSTITLRLQSEADTAQLGQTLANLANPGDCFLLNGQIGVGKSSLARAFIRALLGPDVEVPSPTFTLVQTYDYGDVEIWHTDLYRLGDPQEAVELGLVDAFEDHICLIEWPELLGDMVPESALDIHLEIIDDAHLCTISFDENWASRMRVLNEDA